MNGGATTERVYEGLKRRIRDNAFRPGERLDPARLGEALHSSVTPIRDALHVLAGERLVEARPSEGFHLPPVDAPALQDLLAWRASVLMLALRQKGEPAAIAQVMGADGCERAFAAIARGSPNTEHWLAVASANDRLAASARLEPLLLDDLPSEAAHLQALVTAGDIAGLRQAVAGHLKRRQKLAIRLVRLLYRPRAIEGGIIRE